MYSLTNFNQDTQMLSAALQRHDRPICLSHIPTPTILLSPFLESHNKNFKNLCFTNTQENNNKGSENLTQNEKLVTSNIFFYFNYFICKPLRGLNGL